MTIDHYKKRRLTLQLLTPDEASVYEYHGAEYKSAGGVMEGLCGDHDADVH